MTLSICLVTLVEVKLVCLEATAAGVLLAEETKVVGLELLDDVAAEEGNSVDKEVNE